jgi:hypothetical protein
MVSGPLRVHLFRIKWFWTNESIDLNAYLNQKTFKTYTKSYDVYDQILSTCHLLTMYSMSDLIFLQIGECGSKIGFILVFWAARTLPASCPGSHKRVWSPRSADSPPVLHKSRLGFSLWNILWALASLSLLVRNSFCRYSSSAHTGFLYFVPSLWVPWVLCVRAVLILCGAWVSAVFILCGAWGRCETALCEGVREVRCGITFKKCVACCVNAECECAVSAIFPPQWCVVLSRPVWRYICWALRVSFSTINSPSELVSRPCFFSLVSWVQLHTLD